MSDRLAQIEQHVQEHVDDGESSCVHGVDDEQWLIAYAMRLRTVLEDIESCGHWPNCPTQYSDHYRCRCMYSEVTKALHPATEPSH